MNTKTPIRHLRRRAFAVIRDAGGFALLLATVWAALYLLDTILN